MDWLRFSLKARLRALFSRHQVEAEMADEMRAHLEMQEQANRAAGMPPDEAHYAALRQFGNVAILQEQAREQRGWVWLEQGLQDLRYSCRQLVRTPGFSIVAILTLALGIGASSAIFTVVNSVLLRPVPYPESNRVMVLQETNLTQFPQVPAFGVSLPNFRDWSQQAPAFESMFVVGGVISSLVGEGEPARVFIARVTGQCFQTFRLPPLFGCVFGPEEDAPGKNSVAVLSHAFWQRQFGGDTRIIGRTLQFSGQPLTVIGVMPAAFDRGFYEVYTPAAFSEEFWQNRAGRYLSFAFGRLKPDATVEQARTQVNAIATRLARQYPATNKNWGVKVTPLLDFEVGDIRPSFYALSAAVGVLLLIACVNIANLLLLRASMRQREISLRAALGACRLRIAGQLLVENLLLAFLGGALGLLAAKLGVGALLALAPADLPRVNEVTLDSSVVAFTFAVTLLTGIGFGLAPGWYCTRTHLTEGLNVSRRSLADDRGHRIVRNALVVAELALSLILLTGAGLLARSYLRLAGTSPGFEPQGALMMIVSAPQYDNAGKQLAFADAMIERLRKLPGVGAVGMTPAIPFTGHYIPRGTMIKGETTPPPGQWPVAIYYSVTPDYFQSMGIVVLRGRAFTKQDRAGGPPVAVVSQTFARRHFPGGNAIGQRIAYEENPDTWREIVGIVNDVRHNDFDTEVMPQTYAPFAQDPGSFMTFVVRTEGDLGALPAAMRRELHAVDPTLPVFQIDSLSRNVAGQMARRRFAMVVVGLFSVVALILAIVGVYGAIAYVVAQRTGEFGVRLALGARPTDLMRLVLGQGFRLIALGIAIGAAGAYGAVRFIQSLLYQTPAHDPLVFAGIAALLAGVALLACWVPVRRAAKVDPIVALRVE